MIGAGEHPQKQATWISGPGSERVSSKSDAQVGGAKHHHTRGDMEPDRNGPLDPRGFVAVNLARNAEDDVPAVEHRADVHIAKRLDERAQVRHGDTIRTADVDAP